MLRDLGRAFRTPELRGKIIFTLAVMAIFRLGSFIPTPGVSYSNVQECIAQTSGSNNMLGLVNLFSGGALLQLSIFALGIMPYITASIIVQLLTVVIPRFETLKKEGQAGTSKLTQYTRYLTIGLAILQSTTFVAVARSGQLFPGCQAPLIPDDSIAILLLMVITMTAGTGLIMWLGELITERGIGNGMSLLIFTSIAAGFPASIWGIGQNPDLGYFIMSIVIVMGFVILALVVFVEQCQRRIPVQYAKKMVGRRMYGGTSTYIPVKLNMAGVIPIIFASSMLQLPMLVAGFQQDPEGINNPEWVNWINRNLASDAPLHIGLFFVMILFFTFFYVAITFNPDEVADNIRKVGGFIPGVRAGRPTAEYLDYVLSRITVPGSLYLAIVSMIPIVALVWLQADQNFPFGGASLLIIVGVGLDTVKQIESRLQQHHYEGFLS